MRERSSPSSSSTPARSSRTACSSSGVSGASLAFATTGAELINAGLQDVSRSVADSVSARDRIGGVLGSGRGDGAACEGKCGNRQGDEDGECDDDGHGGVVVVIAILSKCGLAIFHAVRMTQEAERSSSLAVSRMSAISSGVRAKVWFIACAYHGEVNPTKGYAF